MFVLERKLCYALFAVRLPKAFEYWQYFWLDNNDTSCLSIELTLSQADCISAWAYLSLDLLLATGRLASA